MSQVHHFHLGLRQLELEVVRELLEISGDGRSLLWRKDGLNRFQTKGQEAGRIEYGTYFETLKRIRFPAMNIAQYLRTGVFDDRAMYAIDGDPSNLSLRNIQLVKGLGAKASKNDLLIELRDVVMLDSEFSEIFWTSKLLAFAPPKMLSVKVGDVAGHFDGHSDVLMYKRQKFSKSKVAYFLQNDVYPSERVRLIDGNHANLHISNLTLEQVWPARDSWLQQSVLRQFLAYEQGRLYLKVATAKGVPGDEVGSLHQETGYIVFKGKPLHRLIWIYHYGDIPREASINHRNGDRSDNSIENLEISNPSEQSFKRGKRNDNSTGYVGVAVRYKGKTGTTRFATMLFGKREGYFKSAEDAAKHRDKRVREMLGGEGVYNFPNEGEQGYSALNANKTVNSRQEIIRAERKLLSAKDRLLEKSIHEAIKEANSYSGQKYCLDHFYPKQAIGIWHKPDNWTIVTVELNAAKGHQLPEDFTSSERNKFGYDHRIIKRGWEALSEFEEQILQPLRESSCNNK